jgi:hypothetical protein
METRLPQAIKDNPVALVSSTPSSPILSRLIELLADTNLTMNDVDIKIMEEFPELVAEGWTIGSTRKKIKRYPVLARTVNEARTLLWREVGRSKLDGYRVISEALDAVSVAPDGSTVPNHDIRLKANTQMMTLMGECVNPAGAKTNIQVNGENAKILITTSDGSPMPFPTRENTNAG